MAKNAASPGFIVLRAKFAKIARVAGGCAETGSKILARNAVSRDFPIVRGINFAAGVFANRCFAGMAKQIRVKPAGNSGCLYAQTMNPASNALVSQQGNNGFGYS